MIKWLILALLLLQTAVQGGKDKDDKDEKKKDKDDKDEKTPGGGVLVVKYAYYKFAKTRSQSLFDYSGNSNHAVNGLNINSETNDVCCTASGAYFYGTGRYIDMPANSFKTSSMFGTSNNFAVMCWIHVLQSSVVLLELQDGTVRELLMRWEVDAGKLKISTFKNGGSPSSVKMDQSLFVGWNFVGFKISGSKDKFKADLYLRKSATEVFLKSGSPPKWEKSKKFIYFGSRYSTTPTSWYLSETTVLSTLDNNIFLGGCKTVLSGPLLAAVVPPGACGTCPTNCNKAGCNDLNTCLFGKISTPVTSGGVTVCDATCNSCNGELCKDCFGNMMLSSSKGTCECLPGFYAIDPPATFRCDVNFDCCPLCHSACNECSGAGPNSCLTCSDPNAAVDSGGTCVCIDGYVLVGLTCQSCHAPCQTCDVVPTKCTSCIGEGAFVVDAIQGICGCAVGYYSYNNRCRQCPPGCSACLSSSKCTACEADFFSLGGQCVESCPSYYYPDTGSCQACHPSCDTCKGANVLDCLTCSDPYFLSDSKTCVRCPDGQFNTGSGYCAMCAADCKTCSSATRCTQCADPLKVLDKRGVCKYPTCKKGFYRSGNSCLPCHRTCKECEMAATQCSACKANAHLTVTSDCECNTGFTETEKICEAVPPVSVSVVPVSSNELQVSFNDTMPVELTAQDFQITIPGVNFTWSVVQEDNSTFSIQLHFDKNNPPTKEQLAKMKLEFSKRMGGSVSGDLGNFAFVDSVPTGSSNLFPKSKPRKGDLARNSKTITRSVVATGLAAGWIGGRMSSAWCLLNTIQILLFIPMMDFALTQELFDFLAAMMNYNFLPNLVAWMGYSGNIPSLKYAIDFGYDCDSVLLNNGNTLIFVFYGILAYFIYKQLSKSRTRAVAAYFRKKFENMRFTYFVRTWIEMYLEVGITATLKIASFDHTSADNIIESIIASAVLVAISLSPIIVAVFLLHNSKLIHKEDEKFSKTWGEWYQEFQLNKGPMPILYYFLFFVRRLLYVGIIFLLHDFPLAQLILCIICSALFLFYLVRYVPCEDRFDKMTQIVAELGICTVFCMMNVFLHDLSSDLDVWTDIVMFTVLGTMGMCLGLVILQSLYALVQIYQQKKPILKEVKPTKSMLEPETSDFTNSMRPNISYKGKVNVGFTAKVVPSARLNNFFAK